MSSKKKLRLRLIVDGPLQGALVCRIVLYWCVTVAAMLVLAGLQVAWADPSTAFPVLLNRAAMAFGPALIAAVVLLPLVLLDAVRFSHRFAGPMTRLRNEAERLANGEKIAPIKFRDGDYWNDLAAEFNRMADQIAANRSNQREAATASDCSGRAEEAGAEDHEELCGV